MRDNLTLAYEIVVGGIVEFGLPIASFVFFGWLVGSQLGLW